MAGVVTLHVDHGPGRLTYRLFGPDGPIGNPVAHPLSDVALGEAIARSRTLLRHPETPSFRDEAITVGKWLYRNLVPETTRSDIAALEGPIVVSTNINGYPFELCHDGEEFLSVRLPISRSIDTTVPTTLGRPRTAGHMRVLVIGSDPRGDLPFVSRETERIAEQLSSEPGIEKVEVRAGQVTKADVLRSLQEGFELLHYCGHIERRGDGAVGLLLADDEILTADEIGNCHPTPGLVFLNACNSSRGSGGANGQGWNEDLSSIVGGFIRGGTRAAVGTSSDVSDVHAAPLAEEFYQCFARLPFGESLRRARRRCREAAPDSPTFLSFILYGSPTLRLTDALPQPEEPTPRSPILPGVQPRPAPSPWKRNALVAICLILAGVTAYLFRRELPSPPDEPIAVDNRNVRTRTAGDPVANLMFSEEHAPNDSKRCGQAATHLQLGKTLVVCVTLSGLKAMRKYKFKFEVLREGRLVYVLTDVKWRKGPGASSKPAKFIPPGGTYHLAWDLDSLGKIPAEGEYQFRFYLNRALKDERQFTFVLDSIGKAGRELKSNTPLRIAHTASQAASTREAARMAPFGSPMPRQAARYTGPVRA